MGGGAPKPVDVVAVAPKLNPPDAAAALAVAGAAELLAPNWNGLLVLVAFVVDAAEGAPNVNGVVEAGPGVPRGVVVVPPKTNGVPPGVAMPEVDEGGC